MKEKWPKYPINQPLSQGTGLTVASIPIQTPPKIPFIGNFLRLKCFVEVFINQYSPID